MSPDTTVQAGAARIDPATRHVWLDAADPAFNQDPYPTFAALGAISPVFFWSEYGVWCFVRADDVAALLRDRRFGREILHVASREQAGLPEPPAHTRRFYDVDRHSMLEREPPIHTRLRTLVNRAFVSRNIERLRPRIAAHAHALIDGFPPDRAVDLIPAFATPIPVTVIAELLGVPADRGPDLVDWSRRMVGMYRLNRTRADEDAAVAATDAFVAFLRDFVDERRGAPRDDLISHLIAAEAAGDRLSEDELIATCILLLNAGHEATVHAIGNGVKAVLESGLDPAILFATPEAAAPTVEECLRFDPPLHYFARFALEPVDVAGISLRRADRIGLLLGAANRDPARFGDPARFDPTRPAAPHLAFGGGIHFCLGAPLARLELEVALPILFQRLPGLRLAGAPQYRKSWHFRGLETLASTW